MSKPSDASKGFTVIELLVVVGIIGVLVAVLLPVVGRVRRQARSVTCVSNLRQLGFGLQTHMSQKKGRLTAPFWGPADVGPLAAENVLVPTRATGSQSPIMFCPETTEPPQKDSGGLSHGGLFPDRYSGGTFRPWGVPDADYNNTVFEASQAPFRGSSYGVNAWLDRMHRTVMVGSTLPQAARVPVFADAIWGLGFPFRNDPPPVRLAPHQPADPSSYGIGTVFCVPRHGRSINVVFLDGHAANVRLEELWSLMWSNDFDPAPGAVALPAQ